MLKFIRTVDKSLEDFLEISFYSIILSFNLCATA